MFKIKNKGAVLLMLLGAAAGSMAVTNASAMSKSKKAQLEAYAKTDKKVTKTSKRLDSEFDKVGMRNLTRLAHINMSSSVVEPFQPDVFTIGHSLKIGNQNRTHGVSLGKHSVVIGNINTWNFANVNTLTLSKKNQKKVFKVIGNKWSSAVSMTKQSPVAKNEFLTEHKPKTAFAYGAYSNLPLLQKKNAQSYLDQDRGNNAFLVVTADNYLNYYSNYATKSGTPNYTKVSQSIKIKKFVRGKSNYTYYLAKPLKGFGTHKVSVSGKRMYKLNMSLGHVFQSYENNNGDADGFRITVMVGSKPFYVNLGNIAESYAYDLSGENTDNASFNEKVAKEYIQSLQ